MTLSRAPGALALAALAVAVAAGCTKANPRFCESNGDCESNSCDVSMHRCVELGEDGGGPDATIDAMIGCRGNSECASATPICLGADGGLGGMCVECAGHDDCTDVARPVCSGMNRCVPCKTDEQCMMRTESSTIGLCDDGRCLRPGDLAYVAGTPAGSNCSSRTGVKTDPYCTLDFALANEATKNVFHLKPGGSFSPVTISGKNVTIFGRATELTAPNSSTFFRIDSQSRVTLRRVRISAVNTINAQSGAAAIYCRDAGTRYTIEECTIEGNLGIGVRVNDAHVDLRRSKLLSNAEGGVYLDGMFQSMYPTFQIENNFFYRNGGTNSSVAGSFGAILIESLGTGMPVSIRHNSFFDNRALTATPQRSGSIACGFINGSSAAISNNIITGNTPIAVGSPYPNPGCVTRHSLVDDPAISPMNNNKTGDPRYVSTTDLHITAMSAAKDAANPATAASDDIDGDPRPTNPDLGADEIP